MASKVATEGAANLMKYFKNTKTFCSVLEKVESMHKRLAAKSVSCR
jgi:hypothetical protein